MPLTHQPTWSIEEELFKLNLFFPVNDQMTAGSCTTESQICCLVLCPNVQRRATNDYFMVQKIQEWKIHKQSESMLSNRILLQHTLFMNLASPANNCQWEAFICAEVTEDLSTDGQESSQYPHPHNPPSPGIWLCLYHELRGPTNKSNWVLLPNIL